jgi:hypothetical protein
MGGHSMIVVGVAVDQGITRHLDLFDFDRDCTMVKT